MPVRSYVLPDKHLGDSGEQRCVEIELANNPQRPELWCDRYWLYLQQPMKCPFSGCWQQQVQKCLLDL